MSIPTQENVANTGTVPDQVSANDCVARIGRVLDDFSQDLQRFQENLGHAMEAEDKAIIGQNSMHLQDIDRLTQTAAALSRALIYIATEMPHLKIDKRKLAKEVSLQSVAARLLDATVSGSAEVPPRQEEGHIQIF